MRDREVNQGNRRAGVCLLLGVLFFTGCSLKKTAVNKVGDALSGGGTTFASDDDPELIKAAVPFSLKLMESLIETSPNHRGLLFATSSGFTQYAFAFVQQEADEAESEDLEKSTRLQERAKRLYRRGRDYGLRGLSAGQPKFLEKLRADPRAAMRPMTVKEVPLLYWTAASWGSLISLSKDSPETLADQPIIEALIDRALQLQENYGDGAVHSFLINYEMARQGGKGLPEERSRSHFNRAVELSGGKQAAPYVSLAEAVSIKKQNKKEFEDLLGKALAIDADAEPKVRLANLVMQRRARWLLGKKDELFVE